MIAASEREPFAVRFTDGVHAGIADALVIDGGQEAGFTPHALLEAALATCITMTIRMYADRHGWALPGLATRVKLDQSHGEAPVLRYDVDFGPSEPNEEVRERLLRVAKACKVHKTLLKPLTIEHSELVV